MSVYTEKTTLSSILKSYSPAEREKAKSVAINKVRFELPKQFQVATVLEDALNNGNYSQYNEFVMFLRDASLDDKDVLRIITESRCAINLLKPCFSSLVESLLSLEWVNRNPICITEYIKFYVDLLVAHNKFAGFGISKLIKNWIPNESDIGEWEDGDPSDKMRQKLENIHKILEKLLDIIPMTFDIVIESIEECFPYYKKASYIIGGYVYNILWLLEYKPIMSTHMVKLLFKKLLVLDVNSPRNEIEDAEYEDEDEEEFCEENIELDPINEKDKNSEIMKHHIADTLDICMEKLFRYFERFKVQTKSLVYLNKILQAHFDNVILPSHNTHHVQFIMFYICSFKGYLAESFLSELWNKIVNPNVSAPIRQTSVGYIASFLARAQFISMRTLRKYLSKLCDWAQQYIRCSDYQGNNSVKANLVFYSVCQAIFYIIAFRRKNLTSDNEKLLYLQSLHLSGLVTCNLNPLRVCLAPVAKEFAGVTRTYQLAYCHTILERNARRKLATVYANEISMPEECLNTFFPFDPYLLNRSGKRISSIYLQYQPSEVEEETMSMENNNNLRRKRESISGIGDDIDDFIIEKRQKFNDLASRNQDI